MLRIGVTGAIPEIAERQNAEAQPFLLRARLERMEVGAGHFGGIAAQA
jgi:hypothetical protein